LVIGGGIRVKVGAKMCSITTEDDRVFILYSLVDGNVIEINDAVEKDPNIIHEGVRNLTAYV